MQECARYYKDGVPLEVFREVYKRLKASGRLDASFPDGAPQSLGEFVDIVAGEGRNGWVVFFRDELGGVVYLSDLDGGSGRIHFAFVPTQSIRTDEGLPVPVAMARYMTASILRDSASGEFIVDTLVGITPANNTAAIKIASRSGGIIMGIMPGVCRISGQGRNQPGAISYFTRQSTDDAWCYL